MTNKQIREVYTMLCEYKDQLLRRHKAEPLKSSPLFLLNIAMGKLEPAFKIDRKKRLR
jgi:hypothetical protein